MTAPQSYEGARQATPGTDAATYAPAQPDEPLPAPDDDRRWLMWIARVRGRAACDRLIEWCELAGCQVHHSRDPAWVVPPARPAVSPYTLASLERTVRAFGIGWGAP